MKPRRTTRYFKRGDEREHRLIAAETLGRPLKPGEVVHHVNGDTHDNRPENLEVLPSQSAHMRLHASQPRPDRRKFSDAQRDEIRRRHELGESQGSLSRELGCSIGTVNRIVHEGKAAAA